MLFGEAHGVIRHSYDRIFGTSLSNRNVQTDCRNVLGISHFFTVLCCTLIMSCAVHG